MQCSTCNSELPPQQRFCPHCGTFAKVQRPLRQSLGARRPGLLITLCLLVLLAAAGSIASGVYLIKRSGSTVGTQNHASQPRPVLSEVVVDHGGVVQPEELQGHGTLYFVPMGRQAIPAQSLADYYRQKFKIEITVLPGIDVEHSSCVAVRRQCIAEEMIIQARYAYPQITRVPDSVMIV